MEYSLNYHMKCSLTLDSGRTATLKHLDQSQTYAGMLEGTPNKKSNEWGIDADMKRATEHPQTIGQPYLIAPVTRDYLREPGDMDSVRERTSKYIHLNGNAIPNGFPSYVALVAFNLLQHQTTQWTLLC